MQEMIVVAYATDLSHQQAVLVVAGSLLAIVAAIVTNVMAARRGHNTKQMDEQIADTDEALKRTHSALANLWKQTERLVCYGRQLRPGRCPTMSSTRTTSTPQSGGLRKRVLMQSADLPSRPMIRQAIRTSKGCSSSQPRCDPRACRATSTRDACDDLRNKLPDRARSLALSAEGTGHGTRRACGQDFRGWSRRGRACRFSAWSQSPRKTSSKPFPGYKPGDR